MTNTKKADDPDSNGRAAEKRNPVRSNNPGNAET